MRRSFVLLVLIGSTAVSATDWPTFRGPDRNGAADAEGVLQGKTFGFEVDWKVPLGSGYSAISVVDGKAVVMYSNATHNMLAAYSATTGESIWQVEMGPVYKGHSGSQDGPAGTPTVDDGVVYALDTHGEMLAVSLDAGKKLWGFKLDRDVPARVPHYGFSTVPLIHENKVILMTGDAEGRAFTAFDKKTGSVLWRSGNDTVTYQSPGLHTYKGQDRILGITDHFVMELDPKDGRVIWQAEHNVLDNESYMLPMFMGENRLLVMNRRGAAGFKLNYDAEGKGSLEELWRGNQFQRTYALPVYHEGYLYGFRGQFLTCVNPATGEVAWRSRPPGGLGLSLLDGHLIIIGNDGSLVAAKASHEGYQEKARIELFDRTGYSAASYVNGKLYLRNLSEMARVSIVDRETLLAADNDGPELKGAFGKFIASLEGKSDKQAAVDAYMKQQKSFPIIEDGGLVHYIYRGDVSDIAVARQFADGQTVMHRVEGTDLYFSSEELDPAGHWEYTFSSFGDPVIDPLNPNTLYQGARMRNELRMPNWKQPDFLGEAEGERGKIVETVVKTGSGEKTIHVYLPHGYDQGDSRYPLLVMHNGPELMGVGMENILNNLVGKRTAPMIVALIPGSFPEYAGEQREAYATFLGKDLPAYLDANYRTITDPSGRGIVATASSTIAASTLALEKPYQFGAMAVQSFFINDAVRDQQMAGMKNVDPKALRVLAVQSTNDYTFDGFNAVTSTETLIKELTAAGAAPTVIKHAAAPGWGGWRAGLAEILAWFAPKTKS